MYERNVGLRKRRSEPLLSSTHHKKGKLKLILLQLNKVKQTRWLEAASIGVQILILEYLRSFYKERIKNPDFTNKLKILTFL